MGLGLYHYYQHREGVGVIAIFLKQTGAGATLIVAIAAFIGNVAAAPAETFTGSGVVIGTKGEILTNAHVVEACQKITVKLPSGNSQPSALVAHDERNDLAGIRLSGTDKSPASIAMFREGLPVRPGDAIVALGYPLSGVLATEANVSVGNVSALAGVADDSRYLQISAPVQPGNSGGPLLDASGHLVGIVTAKLNALRMARYTGDIPENVNFALKAEVARTFLDSKGIKYQMERSDKQLSPADVGEIGRPFTVHIECEQAGARSIAAVGNPSPSQRSASPSEDGRADQLCKDYVHPSSLSKKAVDAIIEACSIVIGSNSYGPKVVEALLIRGAAYRIKHEYPKANQDLKTVAQSSYASDKRWGQQLGFLVQWHSWVNSVMARWML
jgi:S1-C subfamily serine protease